MTSAISLLVRIYKICHSYLGCSFVWNLRAAYFTVKHSYLCNKKISITLCIIVLCAFIKVWILCTSVDYSARKGKLNERLYYEFYILQRTSPAKRKHGEKLKYGFYTFQWNGLWKQKSHWKIIIWTQLVLQML